MSTVCLLWEHVEGYLAGSHENLIGIFEYTKAGIAKMQEAIGENELENFNSPFKDPSVIHTYRLETKEIIS